VSLQSISVALDTYTPLVPAHLFSIALWKLSFARPSFSVIIPISSLRKAERTQRHSVHRREKTGETLICLPRVKATVCEVLSLALETRLSELAKLDVTRETLISAWAMRGGRWAHYDRGQTQSAKYAYKRICSRRKTHLRTWRDTRKLKARRLYRVEYILCATRSFRSFDNSSHEFSLNLQLFQFTASRFWYI